MQLPPFFLSFGLLIVLVSAEIHHHEFVIKEALYTRLCRTKPILTVNGQFPGPAIHAHKGDSIVVRVYNHARSNATIHWHGVAMPRNPWFDGPEYITQCPIKPGSSFTYRINLTEEEGTLWWHAHSGWDRATVHGAIVVHPKHPASFPFREPHEEILLVLGEWWASDVGEVIGDALRTGGDTNTSDAFMINGQPGDLYPCSKHGTFSATVERGKRYLIRLISAAVNNELFFAIAGHRLTVVGRDGSYTKPLPVDYIMITPGQTMDLLLEADQPAGRYYMAARAYWSMEKVPFSAPTTTTAILEYKACAAANPNPQSPYLPNYNDTIAANGFINGLRSLASKAHPVDVPQTVDEGLVITVSINLMECPGRVCMGFNGTRISSSLNNISFGLPTSDVLQAYYKGVEGVYGTDFPNGPSIKFDFTDPQYQFNFTGSDVPASTHFTRMGTEVKVLEYGKSVEVVFQGTSLVAGDNHPMHLHGQSFYVVGRGIGDFDEESDPSSYNLVDPPYENTVAVPKNGWTTIRFKTLNPGVWFMHCHLGRHMSWGMSTVFIVKNGDNPNTSMLPPPKDLPQCFSETQNGTDRGNIITTELQFRSSRPVFT